MSWFGLLSFGCLVGFLGSFRMNQGLGLGLGKEAQGGAADAAGAARGRYVLWVFSPENSLD